jgi:uncharacterized protein YhbP (UPF0306 family)
MKMDEIKQKIEDYLVSHNLLSFATADAEGNPFVRSVEYVNDGHNIYFLTDGKSTKVKHIHENSNIAFTVDEDISDWSKIQGIQMRGKAVIVSEKEEEKRVMEMLLSKFPQFNKMPSEGVEICVVKIIPTTGIFIDNPSGFGNRYEVHYC